MPGIMGMQQIADMHVLGTQVLSVQALRSQIAPGGFRRGLDAGEQKLDRIHGGTCGRSERNWYA
jgi:hypothetical protein